MKICTTQQTIFTNYVITALEAILPVTSLLRVHRSFLMAPSKINSFTPKEIDIQLNLLAIGNLYWQQVLKTLTLQGKIS